MCEFKYPTIKNKGTATEFRPVITRCSSCACVRNSVAVPLFPALREIVNYSKAVEFAAVKHEVHENDPDSRPKEDCRESQHEG